MSSSISSRTIVFCGKQLVTLKSRFQAEPFSYRSLHFTELYVRKNPELADQLRMRHCNQTLRVEYAIAQKPDREFHFKTATDVHRSCEEPESLSRDPVPLRQC
jgi:hypothetical protein